MIIETLSIEEIIDRGINHEGYAGGLLFVVTLEEVEEFKEIIRKHGKETLSPAMLPAPSR